jgi:prepilin-type N-terminal cleavage/methylation domain-containing protein
MSDKADNPGTWGAARRSAPGFTLLEVVTALAILGLVSSSVLLVINRCMDAAANSVQRLEAFRLVQENLEKILVSESVSETVDYGTSELYPDIAWQTVIEAFPEPATGKMWARAVCSAEYTDSAGERQTVKLEHWLAELTDQQAGQLASQEDLDQLAAEQLLETIEDAAAYAGVRSEVIEEWVEKGLATTDEGAFIKYNLDLFMQSKGEPTAEDKRKQVKSIQELAMTLRTEQEMQDGTLEQSEGPGGRDATERPSGTRPRVNPEDLLNRRWEEQR